jgi:aminoglycoside phosphotransferase (APT) family kinase protein
MPEDERLERLEPLYISDDTLRALIDEQFPYLAERELGRRYTLEDHFAVRIGDDFGAIFPRYGDRDELYERAADLIVPQSEHWTFNASYPIAQGVPGHDYPYHWNLVRWVSASTAGFVPLHSSSAGPLGNAIAQIHRPAPLGAPTNPHTSISLPRLSSTFDALVRAAAESGAPEQREIDVDAARAVFDLGASAPMDVQPTWTHGRLEPRAVLSDRGNFAGILLWHNFGMGDPAADLGYASNLLPREDNDVLLDSYGAVSRATRERIGAFQVLGAVSHIAIDDPFVMRIAWERLIELDLAREA